MIRKGLTKVDKITCVSKYAMEVLENSGVQISNKPIVIYNGVDIGEIRRYSAHELPLEGKFKVLFPGGAKAWKGGDLLIESLPRIREKIPNVHVYFAGLLPKMHKLSKLVEERKLENSITFMGFLPPQRYFQVLSSTDVLVFPSMNEAFPMVLLEAMALGKPIVATNMGGIPEVIKDGFNGILVERDPKCIADAVIHLCDNRHLYEEISQNSLKTVESFDWDNIIDKYIELYRTLCGNSVSEGSM
jgi:glycosyltransferase involved in cell wall biosynthesis